MAVNPIMTETLPTLVGMGVVAHTVDRVMPRRRPKRTATMKKTKSRKPKVYKGPRGGKYVMRKGRRVYV